MIRQNGPLDVREVGAGGGSGGGDVNLTEIGGVAVTLGQKLLAASLPVAIASDQGLATGAKQDDSNTLLTLISFDVDASAAVAGATTGAAVITDANGTLQQYLRGLIKLLITSGTIILGAGTNAIGKLAANAGVNIGDVGIPAIAIAATVTSVNDLGTNQTLLSLNAVRKGYKLFNASSQVAYVKEGTTATTSDYSYQIGAFCFYESVGLGCYTGRIDAIWAADSSGAMKITELA